MMLLFRTNLLTTSALLSLAAAVPAAGQTVAAATQAEPAPPGDTQAAPETAAVPAPGASDPAQGDVLVTARRREESIVDVPLAITVVGSKTLEKLDITSTEQLANFTPGLQFSDFTPGNSRNDRGGNRPLIFRGLNLSNNGGVTGAGSMFLDGAAVTGNEIPAGMDIGAVEVLRGPQNVYFGRASMTGAVSYRTKPIPDQWTQAFDLTVAERKTYRAEASIAGPVIPGLLGLRLTGLAEGNDGYITNDYSPDGDKLGARSRKSISATVDFTPAPSLEIKLYANYFRDDDGMGATANIFPQNANCLKGAPVTNLAGVVQPPFPTICGEVPGRDKAINYSNTVIPTRHADVLFSIPFLQSAGFTPKVGLQREAFNSHAVINFEISDYLKFQSITGYHFNTVQQVGDGIQQPVQSAALYSEYFYNLANKFNDFSQEVRFSSDPERTFSWTVGANYVDARNQSTAVVSFVSNLATTFGAPNNFVGAFVPFPQNLGDDRAKTYGAFAGGYLKLFDDRLTLSAEARYQIDKRKTITRAAAGAGAVLSTIDGDFKSFNPRVSIDYAIFGDTKVYASYARGSRPGGFNGGFLVYFDPTNPIYTRTSPPPLDFTTVTTDITNTFGPVDLTYDEEKLEIGELGFKGTFAGGRGFFDINGYYGVLSNQQVRRSLVVPALGFGLGAVQNTGKIEIYGIEWSGNFNVTKGLSLATTFAWNHTNRLAYFDNSPATVRQFGIADFSGTELPNTPEYSGSAVVSYEGQLTDDLDWFSNVAIVYRGRQWADIANYSYIPGRTTVDLRIGVQQDNITLEGFATNLFNNKTYPGGNIAPDFGGNGVRNDFGAASSAQYAGFFGAYAVPRTIGLRVSTRF